MTSRRVMLAALLVAASGCGGDSVSVDERIRCTPVAEDSSSVTIDPAWEPGMVRTYEVAGVTDYGGGLVVGLPTPGWARLHVVDGRRGIEIQWEGVPSAFATTMWQFGADPLTATRAGYEWTGEQVRPEVLNPFELGLWLGDAIDSTRLTLEPAQLPSFDQNVAVYEGLAGPGFDQLFLEPAEMLHTFEGLTLQADEITEVSRPILTGLVGRPLDGAATVEIGDLEDSSGCVAIRMTRAPDDDVLEDALGLDPGVSASFQQTLTAQYDAAAGLIRGVEMETVANVGGVRVTDMVTVVDITPQSLGG